MRHHHNMRHEVKFSANLLCNRYICTQKMLQMYIYQNHFGANLHCSKYIPTHKNCGGYTSIKKCCGRYTSTNKDCGKSTFTNAGTFTFWLHTKAYKESRCGLMYRTSKICTCDSWQDLAHERVLLDTYTRRDLSHLPTRSLMKSRASKVPLHRHACRESSCSQLQTRSLQWPCAYKVTIGYAHPERFVKLTNAILDETSQFLVP